MTTLIQRKERLLVVSNAALYRRGETLLGYAPYVREIDIWADLFPEVVLASPVRPGPAPGDCVAFSRTNIRVAPQPEAGGKTAGAKLRLLCRLPRMVWSLGRAMLTAGAVHVRCPANTGLLGVLMAPALRSRRIAKYAGQWSGYPGEPWTSRLQRFLLRSRWWGAPVTVYGEWPNQPAHVKPFFTTVLTGTQVARAREIAANRRTTRPLRVIFVGRLSRKKNVDVLLRAASEVIRSGAAIRVTIAGHGPERERLEALARQLGIVDAVVFTGGLSHEQVLDQLERHDVHVLVSETEGWPKATAEAMAFGLVAIGSRRGLLPRMLGDGRGITVPPGDAAALAVTLRELAAHPERYDGMRARAAAWGQRYSLENLRAALAAVIEESWDGCAGAASSAETTPA